MKLIAGLAVVLLLGGCSSSQPTSSQERESAQHGVIASVEATSYRDAQALGLAVMGDTPSVVSLIQLVEANDPHGLLGDPDGYLDSRQSRGGLR